MDYFPLQMGIVDAASVWKNPMCRADAWYAYSLWGILSPQDVRLKLQFLEQSKFCQTQRELLNPPNEQDPCPLVSHWADRWLNTPWRSGHHRQPSTDISSGICTNPNSTLVINYINNLAGSLLSPCCLKAVMFWEWGHQCGQTPIAVHLPGVSNDWAECGRLPP